jgi:hypothetical protein
MFDKAIFYTGSTLCLLCAATSHLLGAQATTSTSSEQSAPNQSPPAPLPNAPTAQTTTSSTPSPDEKQSKRIMGALPNFRSVTAGEAVPPETARQKIAMATLDNFDYTSLFFAGIIAADSFVAKGTPEFHQGAAGYARYYWHTVADQSVENYFVELIVPAATHEDSRYFAMGKNGGGFWRRAGYSLSRVVVTRKDSGESTFNISEIAGSATAVTVSNFYYPSVERTVKNGFRNWGLDVTYDAVTFTFHEFWPDIEHALLRKKSALATGRP